ncbi:DUF456 domain-containing protein [Effusibacillus dendaii]|uniref:DUF456 domain-containing protein n=1 Tax=Effusibacillus dendaii TaxID=2743772 RepID=A0A7I8D8M3_9BACL|nr:DUF456 domain-containing protein [Effusibacillus dendaii]BCJ85712.1 hypothetical protein skT53_06970 [Effusibacillus dendaii]
MGLAIAIIFFLAGVLFTIYPILPGALFVLAGMVIYGLMEGWSHFPLWFWVVQVILTALNFTVDWLSSVLGIKRAGGSKWAVWGSIIGTLVGPLVAGPFGILIGPVAGAMIGQLVAARKAREITRVGIAVFLGFIIGTFTKLMIIMIQMIVFAVKF